MSTNDFYQSHSYVLKKYVKDIKKYGYVHSLLHLVKGVEQWGPHYNFSTFPYKNMLGVFKGLPNSGFLPMGNLKIIFKKIVKKLK